MKKAFTLFSNLIYYIFLKNIFLSLKEKNYYFFVKLFLFYSLFNVIILFPFLVNNIIKTLIILSFLFIIFILIFIFLLIIFRNRLEFLNNSNIKLSTYKLEFFNFLKNDFLFNISCSFLLLIIFLCYIFFIFTIVKFYLVISISSYFLNIFIYFSIIFIFVFSFNFFYYKFNKNRSKVFVNLKDYKNFKYSPFLINILIFFIVYILAYFIINIFIKSLLSFLYSLPFSLLFALPFFKIFASLGVYKKINFYILEKKIKIYFDFIGRSIDKESITTIIKSYLRIFFSILIFMVTFLFLLNISRYMKFDLKIILFYSFSFSLFFSYSLFIKDRLNIKIFNKSYYFTCFLLLNSVIIITISYLNFFESLLTIENNYPFKEFIVPLFMDFKNFFIDIKIFFDSIPLIVIIFFPLFFILLLKIIEYINTLFLKLTKVIDEKLKASLTETNANLIFGDSLSFYPFIFFVIINYFVLKVLYIEIKPFSDFFYTLVNVFQIDSVFKFYFLTKENINTFFNIFFVIFLIFICIKMVLNFFSTILSHFMLFNDEIVYINNRIISKTILRIPLTKINYFIVKQNLIEKFFDIGSIYIETQDKNGIIKIDGISSIKEKNILIMEKIKSGLQKI